LDGVSLPRTQEAGSKTSGN